MNTTVTSITKYAAAKERERLAELDRAVMARAQHLKPMHNSCTDPRIKEHLFVSWSKGAR